MKEVNTSMDVTTFEVLRNDRIQERYMCYESALGFFNRWPKRVQKQMKIVKVHSLFMITKEDLTP